MGSLRILFGTKRAFNRVIIRRVCPVNLKISVIIVPIEEDNYDYTGRNIAAFKHIFIEQYEFAVKNYF